MSKGTNAVTGQLTDYVNKCPSSGIILVGISQGAQIILDALCGSGDPDIGGTGKPSVPEKIGSHGKFAPEAILSYSLTKIDIVKAVAGYGDPGYTIGEVFDKGASTENGVSGLVKSPSLS